MRGLSSVSLRRFIFIYPVLYFSINSIASFSFPLRLPHSICKFSIRFWSSLSVLVSSAIWRCSRRFSVSKSFERFGQSERDSLSRVFTRETSEFDWAEDSWARKASFSCWSESRSDSVDSAFESSVIWFCKKVFWFCKDPTCEMTRSKSCRVSEISISKQRRRFNS